MDPARIFLQYYCEQNPDLINKKRHAGLIIAAIFIFCSLMLLVTASYLQNEAHLDYQLWDFNTCTAGDFTIKFMISEA